MHVYMETLILSFLCLFSAPMAIEHWEFFNMLSHLLCHEASFSWTHEIHTYSWILPLPVLTRLTACKSVEARTRTPVFRCRICTVWSKSYRRRWLGLQWRTSSYWIKRTDCLKQKCFLTETTLIFHLLGK